MQLLADYGDIYVSLPRCFRGPINISTGDSRIALSPALEDRTALLSDIRGTRVYFVGDRPHRGEWGLSGDRDQDPEGPVDELYASGKFTSVRINWVGEEAPPWMGLDVWSFFRNGAVRFLTSGRVW